MKESYIEGKLVQGVKKLGGVAYKFVSPGNNGVPDRMVILPGGHVAFVELKTDEGRLSKIQTYQIHRMKKLGADVVVAYGMLGVQMFLEACQEYLEGDGHEI